MSVTMVMIAVHAKPWLSQATANVEQDEEETALLPTSSQQTHWSDWWGQETLLINKQKQQ